MSGNVAYGMLSALQRSPKSTCLVVDGDAINKEGFHRLVTNYAEVLKRSGAQPGDRILITISIGINFYAMAVATLAIGAAIVIINTTIGRKRIDHCVKLANPAVWVFEKKSWLKYVHFIIPSLRRVPIRVGLDGNEVDGMKKLPLMELSDVAEVDIALITFTTGSTGMPKMLLRKHQFIINQSKALSITFKSIVPYKEEDSTFMTNLNVFGLHFLRVGSTGMICSNIRRFDCDKLLKLLTDHKLEGTILLGSPYFLNKIALHCSENKVKFTADYAVVGGAPVYRKILKNFKGLCPDDRCFTVYGCTEIEPISYIQSKERCKVEDDKSDGHCVGKPAFEGSVKIIRILTDEELANENKMVEQFEVANHITGEVIVCGWHVNTYQVGDSRILKDKEGKLWLRTEDAGYLDDDGRVWLMGRVKWRIERDDKTYWSIAVEQKVLDRCSLITFAAYLPHEGKAWLVLEAPQGLPFVEQQGILSMLKQEGIPVDVFKVFPDVPKDWRHNSKPNTALLFSPVQSSINWTIITSIIVFVVIIVIVCLLIVY